MTVPGHRQEVNIAPQPRPGAKETADKAAIAARKQDLDRKYKQYLNDKKTAASGKWTWTDPFGVQKSKRISKVAIRGRQIKNYQRKLGQVEGSYNSSKDLPSWVYANNARGWTADTAPTRYKEGDTDAHFYRWGDRMVTGEEYHKKTNKMVREKIEELKRKRRRKRFWSDTGHVFRDIWQKGIYPVLDFAVHPTAPPESHTWRNRWHWAKDFDPHWSNPQHPGTNVVPIYYP